MLTLKQNSFKRKNIVTKSVYWATPVKGNSVSRDKQAICQTNTNKNSCINIEFIKKKNSQDFLFIFGLNKLKLKLRDMS